MLLDTLSSIASLRTRLFARAAAPLVLIGLVAVAACDDERSTPTGPAAFPATPLLGKGNGGGGGGGGGYPMPSGRLYFTSDVQQPGNLDVYAVNPDGTGLTRLTTAPGDDQLARATTTGRIVFFSDRSGNRQIFTMNRDGSNQQAIYTPSAGTLGELAVSADGTVIAFVATVSGQADIWTMAMNGSGLTRVTNDATVEQSPALSPNGRDLLYSATVNGTTDIFKIVLNRGTVTRLTSGAGVNVSPSFSPDGRDIVFSSSRDGTFELYKMRSSGSNQERILATSGWHEVQPVFAPDGIYVAYLSYLANGGGEPGMRYIAIGTTGQTGPVAAAVWSVSWAP